MMTPESSLAHSISKPHADYGSPNLWSWDLDRVAFRLRERLGWSSDYTALVEQEYRRFMSLRKSKNDEPLGMCGPVDDFWHEHILFTRNYASFCIAVAGGFIHHEPSDADSLRNSGSYDHTLMLLEQYFGPVERSVWPNSAGANCDSCAMCDRIDTVPRAH